VAFGFHFRIDFLDFAFGRNDERRALDSHYFFAVHQFFFPDSEGLGCRLFFVGEEDEGEIVFGFEFFLGGGFVWGDADYRGSFFGEGFDVLAKLAGF